jgi:hypothetical protein
MQRNACRATQDALTAAGGDIMRDTASPPGISTLGPGIGQAPLAPLAPGPKVLGHVLAPPGEPPAPPGIMPAPLRTRSDPWHMPGF